MSVVTGQKSRRWAIVVAAVAALVAVPTAVDAVTARVSDSSAAPRELMTKALASQDVAYSGLATSRGNLGLPDLPAVDSATATLGGTTRTRTWWANRSSWRVSILATTGEQGIYARGDRTYLWDYEDNSLTRVDGVPALRLSRADDLLPPQATRRLLAGVSAADSVEPVAGRRIAGTPADGVRIRPSDERSTIGSIDLWIDPVTGLPLAYRITDDRGTTALESSFTELDLGMPDPAVLDVPRHRGVRFQRTRAPDLAARINQFSGFRLPDQLAGFATSAPIVGGTATYGTGLVRFVVLPLGERNAVQWVRAARTGASEDRTLTGGHALLVGTGSLNLVVAQAAAGQVYAIAGLVQPQILFDAAQELFTDPPRQTGFFAYS